MADITISSLPLGAPSRSAVIPFSEGSTTSKLNITQIADLIIPIGSIIMWSGSIATIPSNWALCNGSNGTIDLRDRFIVGAGRDYAVSSVGGLSSVNLTIDQMPKHNHGIAGSTWAGTGNGGSFMYGYLGNYGTAGQDQGGDQAHENRPPYYALAFIQRIS